MAIHSMKRRVAATRISTLAESLLASSTLCAIATTTPRGRAHVHTAYFAWSPRFDVYWLSDPSARHSRNIRANPSAAVAVDDSTRSWAGADRGIQLFGAVTELHADESLEAERAYGARFSAYSARGVAAYRFYRFRPRMMRLFAEATLGSGVFVTARVHRTGAAVTWLQTEVYRSGLQGT
jgi:uncharacterized protein YhbP (UPF0306 family)